MQYKPNLFVFKVLQSYQHLKYMPVDFIHKSDIRIKISFSLCSLW